MKKGDYIVFQDVETLEYLTLTFVRHDDERRDGYGHWEAGWTDDLEKAHSLMGGYSFNERFANHIRDELAEKRTLREVPAISCGCCGYRVSQYNPGLYTITLESGVKHYRCEKHLHRNPCLVDGCGRTFKIDDAEHHGVRFVCGTHWRMAPKYMRDAVARVRRMARQMERRYGEEAPWKAGLWARHHRLWERTVRAVEQGQNLDMREIEKMFGL